MEAGKLSLTDLLQGPNRYVIPLFQRYYSWGESQWSRLWQDLEELLENPTGTHFLGPIVLVAEPLQPTSPPLFQVIDGQQRTVTLSLLLCALRDLAHEADDNSLAEEIHNTALVHPYQKGANRYRVYPRQRDREEYQAAVDGSRPAIMQPGAALEYFREKIRKHPLASDAAGLRAIFDALKMGLRFVHVTLDPAENPYRIFRSLNATGLDLCEADLIRNYVFMHVPLEEQDAFDSGHWRTLEDRFTRPNGSVDGEELSYFIRAFLMQHGTYVRPQAVFQAFEERSPAPAPAAVAAALLEACDRYDVIGGRQPSGDPALDAALASFRALGVDAADPLLLRLLAFARDRQLSTTDLTVCVRLVNSFIVRRYVCGESAQGYARTFVAACKALSDDPLAELTSFLIDKGFPDDARFADALASTNLYKGNYGRPILEALEASFGHKEQVPIAGDKNIQIEHVMPQTLTAAWRDALGPEWNLVHERLLHTLGNLTLTGYNPELLNRPFQEKRQRYAQSNITLTWSIAEEYETWGEPQILDRASRLGARAVVICPRPASPSPVDGELADRAPSVNDHLQTAATHGAGSYAKILVAAAQAAGLIIRTSKWTITISPPQDARRTLLAIYPHGKAGQEELLHVWVNPAAAEDTYGMTKAEAQRLLGPPGERVLGTYEVHALGDAIRGLALTRTP